MTRPSCASRHARGGRRRRCGRSTPAPAAAQRVLAPGTSSSATRATAARARRRASRATFADAARAARRADPGGDRPGTRARAGAVPQRPADGELDRRRRARCGSSTGSTPGMDDRYFDLGNLSVNNGFDEADDERLLEAYCGEPCTRAALRRAAADAAHVGPPRGDVGRRAAGDLGAGLRLRRRTPHEHFARVRAAVADPRFGAGSRTPAWRVTCRDRPLRDHRRRRRRRSIAYHLAELGWARRRAASTATSSRAARRSTPRGWSASCAARSR